MQFITTRGQSPSFRSSSETSFPLDLASGLTSRLQAASIKPSAPDCTVLPDSASLRVGVPSLLHFLAEEELVASFTERNSSVGGNNHGEVQLARLGESNSKEKPFLWRNDIGESGLV